MRQVLSFSAKLLEGAESPRTQLGSHQKTHEWQPPGRGGQRAGWGQAVGWRRWRPRKGLQAANAIPRVRATAEAQGQIPVSGQTVPPPQGDSVEKGARVLTPWQKGLWALGSGTPPAGVAMASLRSRHPAEAEQVQPHTVHGREGPATASCRPPPPGRKRKRKRPPLDPPLCPAVTRRLHLLGLSKLQSPRPTATAHHTAQDRKRRARGCRPRRARPWPPGSHALDQGRPFGSMDPGAKLVAAKGMTQARSLWLSPSLRLPRSRGSAFHLSGPARRVA